MYHLLNYNDPPCLLSSAASPLCLTKYSLHHPPSVFRNLLKPLINWSPLYFCRFITISFIVIFRAGIRGAKHIWLVHYIELQARRCSLEILLFPGLLPSCKCRLPFGIISIQPWELQISCPAGLVPINFCSFCFSENVYI